MTHDQSPGTHSLDSRDLAWVAAITLPTLLVYLQVRDHLFVYDTLGYVWENPYIKEFSWSNFRWILLNSYRESWQPLTWLTHTLDFTLFGNWTGGHHLVNVGWHLVVSVLLYLLLVRLFERGGRSAAGPGTSPSARSSSRNKAGAGLAALVFALHPLHVESVAMVYERRDVLYSSLLLLSTILYLNYVHTATRRRAGAWYCGSLLVYALSLLSKPMAVTFPVLLLLLDFWYRTPEVSLRLDRRALQLVAEKIPFLLLALPVTFVTVVTQGAAIAPLEFYPFAYRILNVLHNIGFFAGQFILPLDLSAYYPLVPFSEMRQPAFWGPGLAILLLLTLAGSWMWLRGMRGTMILFLATLVSFAPSSGLVHTGGTATNDHYVYLSIATLCAATGWLAMVARQRVGRLAAIALPVAYLLLITSITCVQLGQWRSPLSLWTRTLAIYPQAMVPRKNLALTYILIGEFAIAREHIVHLPPAEAQEVTIILEEEMAAGQR